MNWDPVEELRGAFKDVPFVKADPSKVRPLDIPKPSKDFLINVGLPAKETTFVQLKMTLETVEPVAVSQCDDRPEFLADVAYLIEFGCGYDVCESDPLCLVNDGTGRVVSLHPSDRRLSFVNSSVELLGGFLALFRRTCDESDPLYRQSFRKYVAMADPDIDRDENGLWSWVLEEIDNGLL